MSETHLPDCLVTYAPAQHYPCICARLRLAEQRGFHRGWRTAEAYWRKVSIRYGRRKVQECRDAVAALLDEFPNPEYQIANAAVHTALAAIDALRGES